MEILTTPPTAGPEARTSPNVEPARAAALRPGSVLHARVVSAEGDQVLLALAGRRVPAQSLIALAVGADVLVRVEAAEEGVTLRILDPGLLAGAEPGGLLAALRGVVAEGRPLGALLAELAASLRSRGAAETAGPAARLLEQLGQHILRPGAGGQELLALLGRVGTGYEAALLAAALRGLKDGDLGRLEGDLKAQLLRALAELPEGGARDAVRRALSGLEAEQLLNVARREAGEPMHWALPWANGESWTTAHLFVQPDGGREREEGGAGRTATRVVLGVELSNLGPVRIDLVFDERSLCARFLCGEARHAERIARGLEALVPLLERGERQVTLTSGVGGPEELDFTCAAVDVGVLREQRLMDVSG